MAVYVQQLTAVGWWWWWCMMNQYFTWSESLSDLHDLVFFYCRTSSGLDLHPANGWSLWWNGRAQKILKAMELSRIDETQQTAWRRWSQTRQALALLPQKSEVSTTYIHKTTPFSHGGRKTHNRNLRTLSATILTYSSRLVSIHTSDHTRMPFASTTHTPDLSEEPHQ